MALPLELLEQRFASLHDMLADVHPELSCTAAQETMTRKGVAYSLLEIDGMKDLAIPAACQRRVRDAVRLLFADVKRISRAGSIGGQ